MATSARMGWVRDQGFYHKEKQRGHCEFRKKKQSPRKIEKFKKGRSTSTNRTKKKNQENPWGVRLHGGRIGEGKRNYLPLRQRPNGG